MLNINNQETGSSIHSRTELPSHFTFLFKNKKDLLVQNIHVNISPITSCWCVLDVSPTLFKFCTCLWSVCLKESKVPGKQIMYFEYNII